MTQQDPASSLVPAESQILIKVAAAGVNRADLLQKAGAYPPPKGAPDVLGLEVAGTVAALGPNVTGWKLGDRICALLPGGGYAPYALAHEGCALPIPANLDFVQAAASVEAAFTIWNNIFVRGRLARGETILLTGASSGIGTLAIQIVKALGANVVGLCRTEKMKDVAALGADALFDYTNPQCWDAIKAAHPRIELVLDMVGGEQISHHIDLLALNGRHVSIAFMGGRSATIDLAKVMQKRLVLTGSTLRGRPQAEQTALRDGVAQFIWPLLEKGAIKPIIDSTYALGAADTAHERMQSGAHTGKIVLLLP